MKKRKAFFQTLVFSALVCFGVSACSGGGGDQTSVRQERINITAANSKTTLILGETVQLTPSVEGVAWTSEDPTVATVSDAGLVTSLKVGSTRITATKKGYRDGTITIRVDLEKIEVEASDSSVVKGNTITVTANKEGVAWSSSDTNIATVVNGVVTGVNYGEAVISASKDGFNPGTVTIRVTRPAPTKTLHMEDADHSSADGVWGTSYNGAMYGPGEESPVYARSSGNASDGTCIAYMDNGDREILTFSSNAAVSAELTLTMASRNAVSDLSSVMSVTFNTVPIDLSGKSFEGGGDTNTFVEFSLGQFTLNNGENTLDFNFLGSSPYMDDLNIYAESAATINVIPPAEKDPVTVNQESIAVKEGKSAQITSSLDGLTFKSNNTAIATVDDNGNVTGVKAGETTISVSKDGYKTIKVPVTVSEAEGVIAISINGGVNESGAVTFRTSQNLSEPYNYIVDAWPADEVVTFTVNNEGATGSFNMYIRARASGGYQSSSTDDLATCMEVTVNGSVLTLSGTVSGNSFTDYLLGAVSLNNGANTVTIKCKTTVPTMNLLRFIPNA